MRYAVSVKVEIDIEEEPIIKEYFSEKENYILDLQNGDKVTLLKSNIETIDEKIVFTYKYKLITYD